MELSSVNIVGLVLISYGRNTGSIRDDPHWTSKKRSLEVIGSANLRFGVHTNIPITRCFGFRIFLTKADVKMMVILCSL